MSAPTVYAHIRELLDEHLDAQIDESSRERIALLVMGMIHAESSAPARIAQALKELGLTQATKTESIERRIRRIENDPELTACLCVHPLARQRLLLGRPRELLLIVDPTTQEDRLVMVSLVVWYRGRALPLVWAVWPGNTPLQGERFWARIAALLDTVRPLLPIGVPVTWLADRAFGTPIFTDLITARGWHYVVRVQGQTHCRDRLGREHACRDLIHRRGQRAKLRGTVFKKNGWREASVVVYWGRRHRAPVCIVSDLGAHWHLLALYRRRFPIEAMFQDYKSCGWHWEQGQVTDLQHVEHLLVGMALATWVALSVGTSVATELLSQPPTGHRRTVPWMGKRSLFTLGLHRLGEWINSAQPIQFTWLFTDWEAPNWHSQIYFYHARAFVFAV
jgi:hypothetical protein